MIVAITKVFIRYFIIFLAGSAPSRCGLEFCPTISLLWSSGYDREAVEIKGD
jgi:hypothetical protein